MIWDVLRQVWGAGVRAFLSDLGFERLLFFPLVEPHLRGPFICCWVQKSNRQVVQALLGRIAFYSSVCVFNYLPFPSLFLSFEIFLQGKEVLP